MARPESIAAPTNPRFGDNGLISLYLDYIQGDPIAQQVTGGDPLKKPYEVFLNLFLDFQPN